MNGRLVQGVAHMLLKLLYWCVTKWCHLPEGVFIIEVLKAYSVATVIHQHLKEALVCTRAAKLSLSTSRMLEQLRLE